MFAIIIQVMYLSLEYKSINELCMSVVYLFTELYNQFRQSLVIIAGHSQSTGKTLGKLAPRM